MCTEGKWPEFEKIVKFGATNGQDLACLSDRQKKFRRSKAAMTSNVVQHMFLNSMFESVGEELIAMAHVLSPRVYWCGAGDRNVVDTEFSGGRSHNPTVRD